MTMMEMVMRFSPPAFALATSLALVSSVGHGKRPERPINPLSISLVAQGKEAADAEKYDAAIDSLEAALAVDPRNRGALIAMAEVAKKQGLPGKAIRLYREALLIEPTDVTALAGQGSAMVQRGAVERARENLTRIGQLCPTVCPEQTELAAVIEKGAAKPELSVQAVQPKPVVSQEVKP
jgi:Tfp pilus assembly protein PilF